MAIYERFEDMSHTGRLILVSQEDGDVEVGIIPDPNNSMIGGLPTVEFCTPAAGGGESPEVLEALYNLIKAMDADNRNWPQRRNIKA